jgi:hypothetical protein
MNKTFSDSVFDVTVIIPVFGDIEKWIHLSLRAYQSVLSQTVKPKSIILSIADNIKDARNNPAFNVTTKHIIFLDADDEIDSHYIEEMIKCDGDIIVPSVHRYHSNGEVNTDQYHYQPRDLLTGNYIVIGAMLNTSLFCKAGGFEDYPIYEDWQNWIKMEECGAKFTQCTAAVYKIHVRDISRNNQSNEIQTQVSLQIINETKKRRGLI